MRNVLSKSPLMCSELVSVAFKKAYGAESMVTANLEEISATSALLLSETRIPAGTSLSINCQSNELKGVVASCVVDRELGYFVTVLLAGNSRWSSQWFTPEHLLALPQLEGKNKAQHSHSRVA